MNKNTLLYAGLIIFGLARAFYSCRAYRTHQLSFLYILIKEIKEAIDSTLETRP